MKKFALCFLCLLLLLALTACGREAERPWPETAAYTNLNTPESQALLQDLLDTARIPEARQKVLFDHIAEINALMPPEALSGDITPHPLDTPLYDPYELQSRWEEAHPDFVGYNCRITAFSLYGSLLELDSAAENPDPFLFLDAEALSCDSSALPTPEDRGHFYSFYAPVPTENTSDVQTHLRIWQQSLRDRGIRFPENPRVSLISLVFHDQIDGDQLTVGHTGVLFSGTDGCLYFLEKLAFQDLYRLCRFESREALSDYLMVLYDLDFGQPTAAPMVLENDSLIQGYRPREVS